MRAYNLGFISDEDIYGHVEATVRLYRRSINLSEFNENIVDPIKLTFGLEDLQEIDGAGHFGRVLGRLTNRTQTASVISTNNCLTMPELIGWFPKLVLMLRIMPGTYSLR